MLLKSSPPSFVDHFRLCHTVTITDVIIAEYISNVSGIRVFTVLVDRPLVDGIFVLPTETFDDDGCPHTLEHLIFLGSEKYPYKGVLDATASRCLAEGTNAWTETDHTAYTLTTAGSDGFLNLLEIYLDHILHPVFTDEGFLTEVHSIDQDGSNTGVVYSEMEDHEFSCESITHLTAKTALYPKDCGYRYETGGRLANLRQLSQKKIIDYHQQYYRCDNLSLIIIGNIPVIELLTRLSLYEKKENIKLNPNSIPPWSTPVQPPTTVPQSIDAVFPSYEREDTQGEIMFAWRGPDWSNFYERHVLDILGAYLTLSNAAPLQQHLVNISYPFATDISFEEEPYKSTMYGLRFSDVPRKQANKLATVLLKELQKVINVGIDMNRIDATIQHLLGTFEQRLEDTPEEGFMQPLVEYIVNCPIPNLQIFQDLWSIEKTLIKDLMAETQSFWNSKLEYYFIKNLSRVEVKCMPCRKLAKLLDKEKLNRIKQQQLVIKNYPGGQDMYYKRLQNAKDAQNIQVPISLIQSVPRADIDSVQSFNFLCYTNIANNHSMEEQLQSDTVNDHRIRSMLKTLPFIVHFCDTPSQFIELRAILRLPIDSECHGQLGLSEEEISLIPIISEMIFETGAKTTYINKSWTSQDNNKPEILNRETFSSLLLEHVIDHRCFIGMDGSPAGSTIFPELLSLYISARKTKTIQLVELLLTALRELNFTTDDLISVAKHLLGASLTKKRRCKAVATNLQLSVRYKRQSLKVLSSIAYQQTLLRRIIKNPDIYLLKLSVLYEKVFNNNPFTLHIVCSSDTLLAEPTLFSLMNDFVKKDNNTQINKNSKEDSSMSISQIMRIPSLSYRREDNETLPFGNCLISGSSSKDCGCLILASPGAMGLYHPDVADLLTLCEFLSSCEGPLFNAVRGSGAAYSVSFTPSFTTGELFLRLLSCTDVSTAFHAAMSALKRVLTEDAINIITPLIDSAKCTALFQIVRTEATAVDYAFERLHNQFLRLPMNHSRYMLDQIRLVTAESLVLTAKKYLPSILNFSASKSTYKDGKCLVVVTPSDTMEDTMQRFFQDKDYEDQPPRNSLQRVSWQSLAAWAVTGDPAKTNIVTPLKNEGSLIESDNTDDSDEETSRCKK